MNRFSRPWWITLVFSSVTVATIGYLVLDALTGWQPTTIVVAVLAITTAVDIVTALWMESIAPTRIHVGPGEKALISDASSDTGSVVSGFGKARQGLVLIRGEIWKACQAADDATDLRTGSAVRVVDRRGLTLVVSVRED